MPEGRVVAANEPLLEVTAPIAEAQLVETALLNFVTFETAVASKAVRCRIAAPHAQLVDFSLRRTQSLQAGMLVARVTAIAGFDATSNVAAARAFGLTASGTMAHSYVEAFPDERDAFVAFAEDFPQRTTFLVDTYDTLDGVRNAAELIARLDLGSASGIRLDSGALGPLAVQSRAILDSAGLPHVRIMASGGLDEYALDDLVRAGAPIDGYGVGTKIGVAADAPYLDTAYKLVQYGERPVFQLSPARRPFPAVSRCSAGPGWSTKWDCVTNPRPPGTEPLLRHVMSAGRHTEPAEPLDRARQRCAADLAQLSDEQCRLRDPLPLTVGYTAELQRHARNAGAAPPIRRAR